MNHRTVEALRNLAERPGTEAEGQLAREMLSRIETQYPPCEDEWKRFSDYLRNGKLEDLAYASGFKTCACGNRHPAFTNCPHDAVHASVSAEIHRRFPRGARVFYNRWAYEANCPGRVVGYSYDWSWVRIKFDHLHGQFQSTRAANWHLSTEPVDRETGSVLNLR